MKIPENIQKIIAEDKALSFGTSSTDGAPNINMIGIKKVLDDETIVLADNFFNKTLSNLQENTKGALVTKRMEEKLWYQLKGTCQYINEGPQYEELKKWVKSIKEVLPAKGIVLFKVEEIFSAMPGPDAGKPIK